MSAFGELLVREWEAVRVGSKDLPQLSEDQVRKLDAHWKLLSRWNSRINLTAIRSLDEAVSTHYCECLFFGALLNAPSGTTLLDAGSGAGFPGVPMAVLRPDWLIALLESHQRKGVFLREATRHLANVRVIAERMELVSDSWDWVVSRAVRPSEVLTQVPRLADRIGLLVGERDASEIVKDRRLSWDIPVPVPWGERRFALLGTVPRGTFR